MAETTRYDPAARRYAEAAFAIAMEIGTQDRWRDDLNSIAELAQHPQASAFLANARVSEADKRALVDRALDVAPLAKNLALLLLQRGRLQLAPQIAADYGGMLDASRGIEHAQVTTA